MEAAGIKDTILTVDAAQGLLPGRLNEAGGLLAVLQEAKADGVQFNKGNLRAIVLRRANYHFWCNTDGPRKPAASTYQEYKQDCLIATRLGKGTWGIVTDAKKLPGDIADNLLKLCKERNQMPVGEDLLTVATGQTLQEIVARLGSLTEHLADLEDKKTRLATIEKEIREIQRGGLRKLKEDAQSIRKDLVEKGVLKPKTMEPPKNDGCQPKAMVKRLKRAKKARIIKVRWRLPKT